MTRRLLSARNLELGSGYNPTPGFTHLDANPNAPSVDIVGLAYPLPQAARDAAPFDSVRAVDVLEHLSYRVVDAALAAWRSVLAPGGRLYVQVPDAEAIMTEYVARRWSGRSWDKDGQRGVDPLVAAEWRLMGGQGDGAYVAEGDDWRWNAHYSLWSIERLTGALDVAGFDVESIEVNRHPNLLCWARAR